MAAHAPRDRGVVRCGATTAIGSLPHRDLDAAIVCALEATSIPAIPTLPRRSPAENPIAQSLIGIDGVTVGQYGAISVDASRVDVRHPVDTDLQTPALSAVRAFFAAAPDDLPAVKWQLIGPVTLGMALIRAGVPEADAFDVSVHAVRSHAAFLLDAVAARFPSATQIVFIDEPDLALLDDALFPLAPDHAYDLMSAALAAVEQRSLAGLFCTGGEASSEPDWAGLFAAGSDIVCLPVRPSVLDAARHLQEFLERDGVVAWGVVALDGPIATMAERPWRQLQSLWNELSARGCDPALLRRQAMVTPSTGLGTFTPSVARRVLDIVAEVGGRVREQAAASGLMIGS